MNAETVRPAPRVYTPRLRSQLDAIYYAARILQQRHPALTLDEFIPAEGPTTPQRARFGLLLLKRLLGKMGMDGSSLSHRDAIRIKTGLLSAQRELLMTRRKAELRRGPESALARALPGLVKEQEELDIQKQLTANNLMRDDYVADAVIEFAVRLVGELASSE